MKPRGHTATEAEEERTKVIAERRHLEDVNACFDEVLAGHVPARLVFTF